MKKLGLAMAACALATAGAANAASITYTSNTVLDATVPFNTTLNIQKFDPTQYGTLQSIFLTLYGDVSGTAQAENESDEAETVSLKLAATETLKRPDGSTLVVVLPAVNTSANLGAYDGVEDYGGTSGVTINNLAGQLASSQSFTDAATLALFTGTDTVAAGLRATGASQGTGNGNEAFKFTTKAGGYATITYNYLVASVPEPGTWMMMIAGFGFIGMGMRRRGTALSFS